jgi:hypothetical protein
MKSFSKITKSIIGSSPPPMGMLKDPQTGIETSSADGVARVLLNKHFPGSIDPKPSPNPHHSIKSQVIDLDAQELQFINKTKLIEAFSLFGKHKSAGPDNLKPIVLQNLPENTLKNLCILYKVSIALEYTPKRWTDSKVIFIAKTGKDSYNNPNSFRPISLCSFLLKGLERLILFHLEEMNLTRKPLCSAQHAFRRGKGTETALSEAVDKIESGILTKKYALGIFLDIAGAFNSLSINAATNAMRRRGFPEHITNWYKHFLHHQVSTLELDGKFYTRELKTGTPQGGCLSPLIWNVNFDPILKKLNKKPVKVIGFADDALFIITGHVPEVMVRHMQPYINKIVAWGK